MMTKTQSDAMHWTVRATYAPPILAAALDHGASWVTVVGLAIGLGGLICHGTQTVLRLLEFLRARSDKDRARS